MAKAMWDWESRIGQRVRLRDLHILSTVVRWGSMAKAASHLAMSQSAVSEAIAHLENALRVRLLDRSSKGIQPTIYADALLKRGNVVFDELKQGIKDIEFLSDPGTGEVRISSPEILSAWLIPAAIDSLLHEKPNVTVRVYQQDANIIEFRELYDRNVDLVINRIPANFVHDDLKIEPVIDDQHFVVVGAQSRWARHRKVRLGDLAHEKWIFPPNPVVRAVVQQAFEAEGLSMPVASVAADSVLVRVHLIATGRFVSVFPASVLRSLVAQMSFKVLPVKFKVRAPPIVSIRLKNRTVSPVTELFLKHLCAVANPKLVRHR
jgi:DNA-binding transcriptional LysR family regulator